MTPLYVALGDSMSIDVYAGGPGPGRGAASLLHRNRDADFPDWAGHDLATRGYAKLDLTYDGATTAGVLDRQLPDLDRRADLTTVYDPSDGTGAVPGGALPAWPDGPDLVRALNAVLVELANRHGAVVADVHAHFLGHGSAVGDPGQPDPRPADREPWYCGVIEPNAWGAHEIRRTWWQAISGAGRLN